MYNLDVFCKWLNLFDLLTDSDVLYTFYYRLWPKGAVSITYDIPMVEYKANNKRQTIPYH